MSKFLRWLPLLFVAASASAQVSMVGTGDPRTLNPVPSCSYTKIYVDQATGNEYTASGNPCSWSLSAVPTSNASLIAAFYLGGTRTERFGL